MRYFFCNLGLLPNVFFLCSHPIFFVEQNGELLPAPQMSWTSLSLSSRLWSLKMIHPPGLRCTSTWTIRSDIYVTRCSSILLNIRCCLNICTSLWFPCQGEEKQLSEKSLHPPASPAMLPDHLKCNILKAQMEAAFRVSPKVYFHLTILNLMDCTE